MSAEDSATGLDRIPDWWTEPVVALAGSMGGMALLAGGSLLLERAVRALFGTRSSEFAVTSAAEFAAALALFAALHLLVGVGGTYAYLAYREFDPGLVVERPDSEGRRWLSGLLVLAPLLVGVGVLLERALGGPPEDGMWEVPGAFVAASPLNVFPAAPDVPLVAAGVSAIVVFTLAVAPAVGALFHGIFQRSLRRVAGPEPAVAGTALLVGVATATPTEPLAFVLVVALAAAAGAAYERTGNLGVALAGYVALNAVTLTAALVIILSTVGRI